MSTQAECKGRTGAGGAQHADERDPDGPEPLRGRHAVLSRRRPTKEERRARNEQYPDEAQHCQNNSSVSSTITEEASAAERTPGDDVPAPHVLAEEDRAGERGAERREKGQHGRVGEGKVLEREVDAEEAAEADEPAEDEERADARRADEGVRYGLDEPVREVYVRLFAGT
jgi:hypothetical protein